MAASFSSLDQNQKLKIGTHDGVFHCDEVLGCYLLMILFPQASIVRTRDPERLECCDIVLDVGGVYNPQNHRYDHHQKTFQHTMSTLKNPIISSDVRLSSAGLIYHHFGKDIVKKMLHSENETMIDYVYNKLYQSFVQEIDGIDNGIPAFDGEPLYHVHTHIGNRVKRLNKSWNSKGTWDENEHFQKAMELVGNEFENYATTFRDVDYPAREIVHEAIQNRRNVHPSGEIMELQHHCPWKEHFFELEAIHKIEPPIKYVLYAADDSYRVMGVPLTPSSFLGRKFFPQSWRGLRDLELSRVAEIEGCIFVHSTGFIGGHKTRDGALKMAVKSLEWKDD